jgi:hypothetical protein
MSMYTLTDFFMWGTILNAGLLIVSTLICAFATDWVYRMHSRFFSLSRETFSVVLYCFLGFYKMLVIIFFLVPYITLLIIR